MEGLPPLRKFLRCHRTDQLVTSALARVEMVRAVLAGGPPAPEQAHRQLLRLDQILLSGELFERAATLAPRSAANPRCDSSCRAPVIGEEL